MNDCDLLIQFISYFFIIVNCLYSLLFYVSLTFCVVRSYKAVTRTMSVVCMMCTCCGVDDCEAEWSVTLITIAPADIIPFCKCWNVVV